MSRWKEMDKTKVEKVDALGINRVIDQGSIIRTITLATIYSKQNEHLTKFKKTRTNKEVDSR